MPELSDKNTVSLAGEFAVLSQLALKGMDANMTLGRTKSVDILASDPKTKRMFRIEVKTTFRSQGGNSKLFGKYACAWMMQKKHEDIKDKDLFYCFVNMGKDKKTFKFFVVPSSVVATYVREQHKWWLDHTENRKDTPMRTFRVGSKTEKYSISTPCIEDYEDNWGFKIK
jgi:hypothetical protein